MLSHSYISMMKYREASSTMLTASGKRYLIEVVTVISSLPFRSSSGEVPLLLCDVAHVPSLSDQLRVLRVTVDNRHTHTGNNDGVTVKF